MFTRIFDHWNAEKQAIHFSKTRKFYVNPREIWYVKMGQNIGNEENGKKKFKRPVLILKIVGNMIFAVAMTTQGKDGSPFYHKIKNSTFNEKHIKKDRSYVILSQVKSMDKKRFIEKMGIVKKDEFEFIKQKLREILL